MMVNLYLPHDFGQSYIVPLYEANYFHTKSALCSDFRDIVTSCILPKVLEHCILDSFNEFVSTYDNHLN